MPWDMSFGTVPIPLNEYVFIGKPALGPTFRVYVNALLMGSWCSPSPWLQLHTLRNTCQFKLSAPSVLLLEPFAAYIERHYILDRSPSIYTAINPTQCGAHKMKSQIVMAFDFQGLVFSLVFLFFPKLLTVFSQCSIVWYRMSSLYFPLLPGLYLFHLFFRTLCLISTSPICAVALSQLQAQRRSVGLIKKNPVWVFDMF